MDKGIADCLAFTGLLAQNDEIYSVWPWTKWNL